MMTILNRLTSAAYGMHLADQIALVSVPLIAALVFNASVETIGLLVAAQSIAHLFGSLPSGLIVDRYRSQSTAVAATLISATGFAGAAVSILLENLLWFGIAVTLGGFGIVLFVLVSLSVLPKITAADQLAQANARFEIPRAVTSFAVPLTIGLLISEANATGLFAAAACGGLTACAFIRKLPVTAPHRQAPEGIVQRIVTGAYFVINNDVLRPIAICSLFWNMAFSALLVMMVPLIVNQYRLDAGTFGVALSAFGLAGILGAWTVGRLSPVIPPNLILLFGPASSVVASAALIAIPVNGSAIPVYAACFLLGFGPSMWLVTQNSIRQLVTPPELLGRVNAVIQTAIYGVRPLAAIVAGAVVGATSTATGLILVMLCFLASFSTTLCSRLRSVKRYTDLNPATIEGRGNP